MSEFIKKQKLVAAVVLGSTLGVIGGQQAEKAVQQKILDSKQAQIVKLEQERKIDSKKILEQGVHISELSKKNEAQQDTIEVLESTLDYDWNPITGHIWANINGHQIPFFQEFVAKVDLKFDPRSKDIIASLVNHYTGEPQEEYISYFSENPNEEPYSEIKKMIGKSNTKLLARYSVGYYGDGIEDAIRNVIKKVKSTDTHPQIYDLVQVELRKSSHIKLEMLK